MHNSTLCGGGIGQSGDDFTWKGRSDRRGARIATIWRCMLTMNASVVIVSFFDSCAKATWLPNNIIKKIKYLKDVNFTE